MLLASVEEELKIVVICVDALRAEYAGPRMKGFLGSGLEFLNAYAAGPNTIPSVPTMLTGVVAGRHGLVDVRHRLAVPTIMERLRERGFRSVAYSANTFVKQLGDRFDEWIPLNWLSDSTRIAEPEEDDLIRPGKPWDGCERLKETQADYSDVWNDIEKREGDLFAYVHLMDPHAPYRRTPSVPPESLPQDHRSHRLGIWVFTRGLAGENVLTEHQWEMVRELYRAEVEYVDKRLEFPGDLTILMSDHGEMLGEAPGDGACMGHSGKFFLQCLLRVPFGIVGAGRTLPIREPFNLRFLPALIEAILDGKNLPSGEDLYWEDYAHGTAFFAIKNPDSPKETLVMGNDGYTWYQDTRGRRHGNLDDVPGQMVRMMAQRMARAGLRHHLFPKGDEAEETVTRRLRGLGYIS